MQNQSLEHHERKRTAVFHYDFAKNAGGAVGDTDIFGDAIPDDAIIVGGAVEVTKSFTSGGATTIAFYVNGAADILAATAKASMAAGDLLATVPDQATAADWIKINGAKTSIKMTVAVAALTAGAVSVFLDYYIGS